MMFISRFNKLIHNKILWGAFAFIVILSFVVWQTNTSTLDEEAAANTPGKLDGKPVAADEFQSAFFNTYLSMSFMIGRPLKVTPHVDEGLRQMAWRRLIALRAARDAKITAGQEEVMAAIMQQPFFQEQNRFSRERYQSFVNQFLAGLQATEAQFVEYVRQEVVLTKARFMLAQTAWVAPLEIEQIFRQLYDTFVISYVILKRSELEHAVEVSESDARVYFEAHRADFTLPEKRGVRYVAFPFDAYLDEGALDSKMLRDYYEEHIEDFSKKGAGDLLAAPSFDEIEDDVRARMALELAVNAAADQAADFEVRLAPDRRGNAPEFEAAAQAAGLEVRTTRMFALNEALAEPAAGLDFNRAAFALRQTPDDYFSRPVKGERAYYILAYDRKEEKRLPDFEEARQDVLAAARMQAVNDMLDNVSANVLKVVESELRRGQPMAQALHPFRLEVFTTEPFSIRSGLEFDESDEADQEGAVLTALARHMLTLDVGEVTPVVPMGDGVVIGCVDARIPADRAILESVRNDLEKYIRRRREELAFRGWQEFLLEMHKFEDLAAQRKAQFETNELPEDSAADDSDDQADSALN